MNRDKILILSYPRCGDDTAGDIVKQYFNERRGLNLDLGDVSGNHGYVHLNFLIGVNWQTDLTQTTFLDAITNDFYLLRYQHFSPLVVPVTEMITHIINEDMTTVRLTRTDTEDWVVSWLTADQFIWHEPASTWKSPDQATIDAINASAVNMVITDAQLLDLAKIKAESDAMFDEIDASVPVVEVDFDSIDFDNPRGVLARFFPDPDITPDSTTIRPDDFLTAQTRATISANNDLTNRISQFFV